MIYQLGVPIKRHIHLCLKRELTDIIVQEKFILMEMTLTSKNYGYNSSFLKISRHDLNIFGHKYLLRIVSFSAVYFAQKNILEMEYFIFFEFQRVPRLTPAVGFGWSAKHTAPSAGVGSLLLHVSWYVCVNVSMHVLIHLF